MLRSRCGRGRSRGPLILVRLASDAFHRSQDSVGIGVQTVEFGKITAAVGAKFGESELSIAILIFRQEPVGETFGQAARPNEESEISSRSRPFARSLIRCGSGGRCRNLRRIRRSEGMSEGVFPGVGSYLGFSHHPVIIPVQSFSSPGNGGELVRLQAAISIRIVALEYPPGITLQLGGDRRESRLRERRRNFRLLRLQFRHEEAGANHNSGNSSTHSSPFH